MMNKMMNKTNEEFKMIRLDDCVLEAVAGGHPLPSNAYFNHQKSKSRQMVIDFFKRLFS